MKAFFFILSLLFFNKGNAQQEINRDTIHWQSDHKLKPVDFKGTPEMQSRFAAVTRAGLSMLPYYATDTSLKFNILCIFDRSISWMNPYYISKNLLEHEQGHFDIAEIFRRKLALDLQALEYMNYIKNERRVDSIMSSIFRNIVTQRAAVDSTYDQVCAFPPNPSKQKIWNEKIRMSLISGAELLKTQQEKENISK